MFVYRLYLLKDFFSYINLVFWNVFFIELCIICCFFRLFLLFVIMFYKVVRLIVGVRERVKVGIFWFCVNFMGGILLVFLKGIEFFWG